MNKILIWLLIFFTSSISLVGQDLDNGEKLFKDNSCTACHNNNMKDKLVGPALGGVEERWAEYPKEDLYSMIRNSMALVRSGHLHAVQVYEESNKIPMIPYPNLKDEDIKDILAYIDAAYKGTYGNEAEVIRDCASCEKIGIQVALHIFRLHKDKVDTKEIAIRTGYPLSSVKKIIAEIEKP